MIQNQTYLKILDNTGAKKIMCIHNYNRPKTNVGDKIIAVVKKAVPNMSIKRSAVVSALIVRTKKNIIRKDGSNIAFSENAAILLNKDGNPMGNRMFGPFSIEVKKNNNLKLPLLSSDII
jgi:large subunit ribosomal protein L14